MNEYRAHLMDKPSIDNDDGLCAFCRRPAGSRHHIVPRSAGGVDGPTVVVCGRGNESGCHGLLHSGRLHLDYEEDGRGWIYRHTTEPCKFELARELPFWLPVQRVEPCQTFGGRR